MMTASDGKQVMVQGQGSSTILSGPLTLAKVRAACGELGRPVRIGCGRLAHRVLASLIVSHAEFDDIADNAKPFKWPSFTDTSVSCFYQADLPLNDLMIDCGKDGKNTVFIHEVNE